MLMVMVNVSNSLNYLLINIMNGKVIYARMQINGIDVKFQLDCGTAETIQPQQFTPKTNKNIVEDVEQFDQRKYNCTIQNQEHYYSLHHYQHRFVRQLCKQ